MINVTAHVGDPCIFCKTPHDEVEPGPCQARQSLAMYKDAIEALESCADREPFQLLSLEAQAILDELAACHRQLRLIG